MKKIMFITPDFYPNSTGFANASINLIDSILTYGKEEYDIWVFTLIKLNGKAEKENIHVIRYRNTIPINRITYKYNEYLKAKYIEKIVDENNIDIIFFETNTFYYLQNILFKKYADKIVVRIHSTADTEVPVFEKPVNYFAKKCKQTVFDFMDGVYHIVSTSNYYLDFVRHNFLNDNVYKMWNNKSYSLIYNTAGKDIKPKAPFFGNTFMTMGKMSANGVTQKGIEDLLTAIHIINKEKKLPSDFHLIIVGTGDCLYKIKGLIALLNLNKKVTIIESATHDKVFDMMEESKAIILLSRYEGQSMFITEALANAKPLIITDNNGMQDLIVDGFNGKLVKTGNPQNSASVILEFINYSDKEIEEMGLHSLELYKRRFSPQAIYDQFNELIKRILVK